MTFIHTHESSGKKYTFYDKKLSSNTNNIFTILVGKNGSGKSRLLNSLIMRRLKDEKYVLAFSNSMYHKFPQLELMAQNIIVMPTIRDCKKTSLIAML